MNRKQMNRVHRIFLIFCLLIMPFVYSPTLLDYFHHSRFLFASIVLAAFCLLFVWQAKKIKPIKFGGLDGLLAFFIGLNFASILWARHFAEALFYAQKWLILGVTFLLVGLILQEKRKQKIKYISQLSVATTLLILGIVSFRVGGLVLESGFSNKILYDLKSLFGHKSLIAAYLMLLLPLNLIDQAGRSNSLKLAVLVLTGWQLLVIVLLQSRAMYLAAFMTFCIIIYYAMMRDGARVFFKRKYVITTAVISTVGLMLFFSLAGSDLRDRLNPSLYFESQTAGERRFVWYKTQGLLHDHPMLGVGAGNWKIEFPRFGVEGAYRLQDQDVIFTRAHNDFLELWAELGPAGMLCYAGMLIGPLFFLLRNPRQKYGWHRCMIAAGLLSFGISAFLDFPKERIAFLVIIGVYLAMAKQMLSSSESGPKLQPPHVKGILIILAAGLMFNSYVGLYRYRGEMHARKLFTERAAQRWSGVVELADIAGNKWHRLDPSAVPISFYKGIAHYSLNQPQQALGAFMQAYTENPYNFHIVNNIATVLVSQGKYSAALEYLYAALSINPRFEEAIYNLAYCLNALGRNEEALLQIKLLPNESEKKQVFLRELNKAVDGK